MSARVERRPDQPSTAWKYGKRTTKIPACTPKTVRSDTEPLARPRSRNRRTSRSGAFRRSSQATNPTAAVMPTRRLSSVAGVVQPRSGPSWRKKTSPTTATTDDSEPTTSNPYRDASREFGMDRSAMTMATTTSTTGRTNSHRQLARSTRTADRYIPRMPPPPATPVHTPIALERSSSGKVEVMTARVTGMIIAAPTPLRKRAASMISDDVARPAAALAAPKTTRPASSTGLRPHRSPIAPSGRSNAARVMV